MNNFSKNISIKTKSICLLLSLGLIWGLQFSLARLIITAKVAPFGYAFWQSLGPGILLFFILLIRKEKIILSVNNVVYYAVTAIFSFVIPNSIIYYIAPHIDAGIMAVIANTTPIFLYLLALTLNQERFTFLRFVAIIFAVSGVILITNAWRNFNANDINYWIFLILLSPLSYAIATIFVAKFRPQNTNSLLCATGMLIAGSIILLPFTLATNSLIIFSIANFKITFWLIIFSIFLTALGNILVFELIRVAGAVYFSLVDSVTAISGLIWGFIIFNIDFSPIVILSITLIILAIIFMNQQSLAKYKNRLQ